VLTRQAGVGAAIRMAAGGRVSGYPFLPRQCGLGDAIGGEDVSGSRLEA
jgi:hypothetical protein